jgi:hypothetical protein
LTLISSRAAPAAANAKDRAPSRAGRGALALAIFDPVEQKGPATVSAHNTFAETAAPNVQLPIARTLRKLRLAKNKRYGNVAVAAAG